MLPLPPAPGNAHVLPAPAPPEFNRGQTGHFARECPTSDPARKPPVLPESNEDVNSTIEDIVERAAEKFSVVRFCVNCGIYGHVASQSPENPVSYDFSSSRWYKRNTAGVAAHTVPGG